MMIESDEFLRLTFFVLNDSVLNDSVLNDSKRQKVQFCILQSFLHFSYPNLLKTEFCKKFKFFKTFAFLWKISQKPFSCTFLSVFLEKAKLSFGQMVKNFIKISNNQFSTEQKIFYNIKLKKLIDNYLLFDFFLNFS